MRINFILFFSIITVILSTFFILGSTIFAGSLVEKAKNEVRKLVFEAKVTGQLIAKSPDVLTLADDKGKYYQVIVSNDTQIRPKYWGTANLNDFASGDKLNVVGNFKNGEKSQINAQLVRNLSIENRWGVFLGDVVRHEEFSFVFTNPMKGRLTVFFDNNTKFISKTDTPFNYSNLKVGDRVRVKGIYDKNASKITNIDEIKDFKD